MPIRSAVIVLAVAVSGCATTAIPTDQAQPTQAILDPEVTVPKDGISRVLVKRDTGFVGSACAIRVLINGKPVANLRTGQLVTTYLSPGEYIFGATSTGICGGGDAEVQVQLGNNETKTLRIGVDQGSAIRIGPTAQ